MRSDNSVDSSLENENPVRSIREKKKNGGIERIEWKEILQQQSTTSICTGTPKIQNERFFSISNRFDFFKKMNR